MNFSPLLPQPKRSLKEVLEICFRLFWYSLIAPYLSKIAYQSNNKKNNSSEIHQLHLQSERLKGELTVLEAELESLPHIEGSIDQRAVTDIKNPSISRKYYRLRWYENGIRKEKHLVKEKKKEDQLTVEEAQTLIANATKAKLLKNDIKERKRQLIIIQDKLSVLIREPIDLLSSKTKVASTNQPLIGRDNESAKLENNLLHNISTLVIGEPGIGKTFLVRSVVENQNRQIIWIDDVKALRNVLVENIIKLLHKNGDLHLNEEIRDFDEVKKSIKGQSIPQLCDLIRDSLIGADYIIVIDSLTGLTPANKVFLEKLSETKLPIITCATRKKSSIDLESIYRKFAIIELPPLHDELIKQIVHSRLETMEAGQYKTFLETKILNAAVGNPGIAQQMLNSADSLSRISGKLSLEQIRNIQEPEISRKYFDLTPAIIFGAAIFGLMRFIGHGMNDPVLYVIGGCLFIITMAVSRVMLRAWSE